MQVVLGVRVPVVMPVIGGPPQHALLRGSCGHQGHHELKRAAGLERAMRKITVVAMFVIFVDIQDLTIRFAIGLHPPARLNISAPLSFWTAATYFSPDAAFRHPAELRQNFLFAEDQGLLVAVSFPSHIRTRTRSCSGVI